MMPTVLRWRWLAILGCVSLVAGALGWVVWWSPLLAVDRIEVTGLQRVTRAQVVTASGVRPGTPLARVDLESVRDGVRAMRPVESVHVHRAWPATLRIRVQEREPIAAVPNGGGGYLLLDEKGVRVATVDDPPKGLPVVRIRSSGSGSGHDPERGAALRVLSVLPERLAARVRTLAVERGRISLRLQGGVTVIWGPPERGREKTRLLSVLLRRHDAATYDVSSPEVVTTG